MLGSQPESKTTHNMPHIMMTRLKMGYDMLDTSKCVVTAAQTNIPSSTSLLVVIRMTYPLWALVTCGQT